MGGQDPRALTLDAGALLAWEARDRQVNALLQRAKDAARPVVIPAGALAQAWRGGGPRQARLAMLLSGENVRIRDLTRSEAQTVGELCGRSSTSDVIDASVVVAAWQNGRVVVTSDPGDLVRLDPSLTVIRV